MCGLWQLVHSTFPLISFTECVGSAVVPVATRLATRLDESFMGNCRLKGCVLCRFVPMVCIDPLMVYGPYGVTCPTATVPSWQLRHMELDCPSGGCRVVFCTVVLVYVEKTCDESVCPHRAALPLPECGTWQ